LTLGLIQRILLCNSLIYVSVLSTKQTAVEVQQLYTNEVSPRHAFLLRRTGEVFCSLTSFLVETKKAYI